MADDSERTPLQTLQPSEYPRTSREYAEQWCQAMKSGSREAVQETIRRQIEDNRAAIMAQSEADLKRSTHPMASETRRLGDPLSYMELKDRLGPRPIHRRGSSAEAPMLASEDFGSNQVDTEASTPQSFVTAQTVLEPPTVQQHSPASSLLVENTPPHSDSELAQVLNHLRGFTRSDKTIVFKALEQDIFHADSDMLSTNSDGSISDLPMMVREVVSQLEELRASLKGHADTLEAKVRSNMKEHLSVTTDRIDRLESELKVDLKDQRRDIQDKIDDLTPDLMDHTRELRELKEISRSNGRDLVYLTYDLASVKNALAMDVIALEGRVKDLETVSRFLLPHEINELTIWIKVARRDGDEHIDGAREPAASASRNSSSSGQIETSPITLDLDQGHDAEATRKAVPEASD